MLKGTKAANNWHDVQKEERVGDRVIGHFHMATLIPLYETRKEPGVTASERTRFDRNNSDERSSPGEKLWACSERQDAFRHI